MTTFHSITFNHSFNLVGAVCACHVIFFMVSSVQRNIPIYLWFVLSSVVDHRFISIVVVDTVVWTVVDSGMWFFAQNKYNS